MKNVFYVKFLKYELIMDASSWHHEKDDVDDQIVVCKLTKYGLLMSDTYEYILATKRLLRGLTYY